MKLAQSPLDFQQSSLAAYCYDRISTAVIFTCFYGIFFHNCLVVLIIYFHMTKEPPLPKLPLSLRAKIAQDPSLNRYSWDELEGMYQKDLEKKKQHIRQMMRHLLDGGKV